MFGFKKRVVICSRVSAVETEVNGVASGIETHQVILATEFIEQHGHHRGILSSCGCSAS